MKTAAVILIIVAAAAGMYYGSTVLQFGQPGQVTAPTKSSFAEIDNPTITIQGQVTTIKPSSQDLSLPDLFRNVENSVVQITIQVGNPDDPFGFGEGLGSGFYL